MQVVHSLTERLAAVPGMILTMGRFDGVHRGHQYLIGQVVARARERQLPAAVLSWDPHPSTVLQPDQPLALLSDAAQKIALVEQLGVDICFIVPFDETVRAMSAADYLAAISRVVPISELWVGADFRMGRGRSGDVTGLTSIGREQQFTLHTVARIADGSAPIGSSVIRQVLSDGDVAAAAHLLGRPYRLAGEVERGDQRGRTIGFPTANVRHDERMLVPANGVYACRVQLQDGRHVPAVTNVGVRPTFDGTRRTIEAHLLDWSGDLYGQRLAVDFCERLRAERRFNGIEALVAQIRTDAEDARRLLVPSELD